MARDNWHKSKTISDLVFKRKQLSIPALGGCTADFPPGGCADRSVPRTRTPQADWNIVISWNCWQMFVLLKEHWWVFTIQSKVRSATVKCLTLPLSIFKKLGTCTTTSFPGEERAWERGCVHQSHAILLLFLNQDILAWVEQIFHLNSLVISQLQQRNCALDIIMRINRKIQAAWLFAASVVRPAG